MTIEKFLSFWSQHNTAIIEGLVALVIILSLFLAFRSFFAKKSKEEVSEAGHSSFDASELEKTLQKILQSHGKVAASQRVTTPGEDLGMDVSLEDLEKPSPAAAKAAPAGAVMESPAEVAQLRLTLSESQKKIEGLQGQLEEALKKSSQAEMAAANSAGAGSGMTEKEKEDLTTKLRDLEARLGEYEIISEDIADLSRFREENEQLKKELNALRAGGGSAAPASEIIPTPSTTPVEAPPVEVTPVEAAPVDAGSDSSLIDDELMKEFAAAVEGQKSAGVVEKAGAGTETPKTDETEQLMTEFENFVSKKS